MNLAHRLSSLALFVALGVVGLTCAPAAADYDLDCDDFASAQDAQDYYVENPVEGSDLDRDGDGRACDWGIPGEDYDPDDISTDDTSTRNFTGDGDGFSLGDVPPWGWVIGGVALLWVIGLIRVASD